jgi:manganese transport protein
MPSGIGKNLIMIQKLNRYFNNIGPGPLIAAAFIGPGTVTVCTVAGVNMGFDLIWAVVLSIITTIVLQGMSARIGLITQKSLAQLLNEGITRTISRVFAIGLVLVAIFLGNAAYEAGNISGGALGASLLFDLTPVHIAGLTVNLYSLTIGIIALILLMMGNYQMIQKALVLMVILMSLAFISAAIITRPDIKAIFAGFVPRLSSESIITVVALIGTTVVPYNLFLHSSLVSAKWKSPQDLKWVKIDTISSVVLGGLVSISIVITAAAGSASEVLSAADLALGLVPAFGEFAKYLIAIGLMAAGITSAMTAPLAGALVMAGCFGKSQDLKSPLMRTAMGVILLMGLLFSSLGIRPVQLITFAQLANGILLPLVSAYILYLINQKGLMKEYSNTLAQNFLAFGIWLVTLVLGIGSLLKVLQIW